MNIKHLASSLIAILALTLGGAVSADDSLPEVTHDGLHLVKHTKVRAVWMKPGANLDEYSEVALLACYVAFNKNWQRNYNEEAIDLSDMVTDQDMKRVREELSKEFNKIFTEVLTKAGHKMVTEGGSGVLIVRPAIINLEITAPDTNAPDMEQSFAANAGQMTLYMELYDGKTGAIIARVIDPEALGDDFWQVRNSVTNQADADRVLRRWATLLSDHLATIKAAGAAAAANQ
jgi:hypothetical protein